MTEVYDVPARTHATGPRLRRVACLLAVVAMVAAACGDDDDDDAGGDGSTPGTTAEPVEETAVDTAADTAVATTAGDGTTTTEPADEEGCTAERAGGEVTMGTFAPIRGLDPLSGTNNAINGGTERTALYDALVRYDPETGAYEPWVAERLEPNADFTEWTLTLRPDISFGSGNPLTTAAVVRSIERHASEANRIGSKFLAQFVADMEVVDDLTMVFTLTEPLALFPAVLADSPGQVADPAVIDAMGEEQFPLMPTGAGVGPYEVVRFAPGEEIVLEAKDDYWGGPVCIDQLRFVTIAGAQATYDAFGNGEFQLAFMREPALVAEARADGVIAVEDLVSAATVLIPNQAEGFPAADPRIREAIARALDVDVIDERVLGGTGLATTEVIHPDSRWHSAAMEPIGYDPVAAADLVDEARADGFDGSLTLTCGNDPLSVEFAIAVEALLESVGFAIDVDNSATLPAFIERVSITRDTELACWGISLNEANPWVALEKNFASTSGSNFSGYSDAEFDGLLDDLAVAATPEAQQDALDALAARWNESVPTISSNALVEVIVAQPEVRGLRATNYATLILADAWLDGAAG